jgi:hypothetical protein
VALSPLLSVPEVAARYGCGARAARRIMREARALTVAGRLVVEERELAAWEAVRRPARAAPARAAAGVELRPGERLWDEAS